MEPCPICCRNPSNSCMSSPNRWRLNCPSKLCGNYHGAVNGAVESGTTAPLSEEKSNQQQGFEKYKVVLRRSEWCFFWFCFKDELYQIYTYILEIFEWYLYRWPYVWDIWEVFFLEITKMGRRCSIATLDRSKFGEITKMVGRCFFKKGSYVSPTTHHQFSNPRHHRTWGCIPDIASALGCYILLPHMLQPSNSTRFP